MRTAWCLNLAFLLAVLVLPGRMLGQFQPPTEEELKMKAEPKAPGASAIYLYREETTDDRLHFHTYFERVKVLTEKGKELATIRIPYESGKFEVTDIKGRTIHRDGTVIPLTSKPDDLMALKNKDYQVNTMVFTLPDVQVGSILEYRLSLRYDDTLVASPKWDIQQPYFVRKAHYFFRPALYGKAMIRNSRGDVLNHLTNTVRIGSDAKVISDNLGNFTLDLADIPPIPKEDWMPPLNTIKWRVEFYYINFETASDFWVRSGKNWSEDADQFAKPTEALKQAVEEMVTPGDSEAVKSAKIYAAVMKLNNTDFARKQSEAERKADKLKTIKRAEDVWKQQSGSANEIAMLYVALARAAGLKVWAAQVVNRDRAIFDKRYLSTDQLDDYLAIAEIDGKDVFLDPGEKLCPYSALHWKHRLAAGFRQTNKGPTPVLTPGASYKEAAVTRVADLAIDESGGLQGTIRFILSGPEALHWRQLTLENDDEEVKKQFNESLQATLPDGVHAEFDHFVGLDDYSKNLMGMVKVSGSIGGATGKHFFLPGLFFETRGTLPFVSEEKRISPIDVHYAKTEHDDVTYHLPAGFRVESAPQSANSSWPEHAALQISSTAGDSTVDISRTLVYNYSILEPKDYSGLHDFYQKVASADQEQLVLTRQSADKGN